MAIVRNILVRVGADANPIEAVMNKAKGVLSKTTSDFMKNSENIRRQSALAMSALRGMGNETRVQGAKIQTLNAQLANQKSYLKSLTSSYFETKRIKGEDSRATQVLKVRMYEAAAAEAELRDKIAMATAAMRQQASEMRQNQAFNSYKSAMEQNRRQTLLAQSSLRAHGTELDMQKQKVMSMQSQLSIHRNLIKNLGSEYRISVKETGKDSAATQMLKIKLLQAATAEAELKDKIAAANRQIADQSSKLNKNNGHIQTARQGIISMYKDMMMMSLRMSLFVASMAPFFISIKSIKAAMDVTESENLFEVSMGNMAGAARDWSNQLQQSLGLNGFEVRKNVGLFYNMTTALGLAQNKAYDVSTGITQLAYDMSSFYNMPYEDMFIKLQAGLSGEIEPLRRLGVIVNETTTKNYAYANGIAKLGAELTESQKVLARYGVIMQSTKNAQGDLARTIMSPANQLRLLQTQLQLTMINLGNAFMPIVQIVLPILTNFTKGLTIATATFAEFSKALFGANSAQAQNAASAAAAANAQKNLGNATSAAGSKAKKGLAGFDQLNTLQQQLASNAANAADAMATTPTPAKQDSGSGIIPPEVIESAKKVREALKPITGDVNDIIKSFKRFGTEVKPLLKDIVDYMKTSFAPSFESAKANAINSFGSLPKMIDGDLQSIKGVIKIFSGILKGDWETTWQGIKDTAAGSYKSILENTNITANLGKFAWTTFTNSLKFQADLSFNFIDGIVKSTWGWIKTNTGPTFDNAKTTIVNSWNAIKTKAPEVWDSTLLKIQTTWNWVKNNSSIFTNAKNTIITAFTNIGSSAKSSWDGIKNSIKTSINDVIGLINSFTKKINSIKVNLPSVNLPGIGKIGGQISFPHIPEIPKLKNGAITNGPTLAMIGDNPSGKEAVIPLDNSGFATDLARTIASTVASELRNNNNNRGSANVPAELVMKVGESELGRIVIKAINEVQRQTGVSLMPV